MGNGVNVIKPGFFTTIQDRGRFGYSHLGVPESGAMDLRAYHLANKLLNNESDAAMLECTLVGPQIEFLQDVYFTITGARVEARLDGSSINTHLPYFAKKGHILTVSKITQGSRSYIAFAGGITTDRVLGSRSMYTPITLQDSLKKGSKLPLGVSQYGDQKGVRLKIDTTPGVEIPALKVFLGPEYTQLNVLQRKRLTQQPFTISSLWNRMAIQLEELVANNLKSIVTSPVIPGTVQLTPSGRMLILMRDCQTTGGYPRILQLSDQSLDVMAQKQQGNQILFAIT